MVEKKIKIISEDNANAEDAVTYRCNYKHSSFKTILFIQGGDPVVSFCLTIHSLMKRLDRKTLNINWITIKD